MTCHHCLETMQMKHNNNNPEKYEWRCFNTTCAYYETTKSIRLGSFFEDFRAPIIVILRTIYYYATLSRQKDVVRISQKSRTFVQTLRNKIISLITKYFHKYPIRLGGPGVIVQVDETKLNFNIKSNRGLAPSKTCWALCMVDTSKNPAIGYIQLIERRNAESLIPIIARTVRSGSIIHSDEWKAYNAISKCGEYEHKKVVHKYNFVDPQTGVHTQNVESFNNKIKYQIKMAKGVTTDFREKFITEFLFFDTYKDNVFHKLVDLIKINEKYFYISYSCGS